MHAPIIAASFMLGSLNPKLGAAIQTTASDRAAALSKAPATQSATPQQPSAARPSARAGRQGPAASASPRVRGGLNTGPSGFVSKSKRLDPARQGFSSLIPANAKVMTVRVTVYWRRGSGTDYYSSKGMSATGARLVNKQSAAVDPAVIPYGSRIILPEAGKELVAVDTGTAVKKRTAARKMGKDVPVVDIFFECKKEALEFASRHPLFMKAVVVN